MGVSPSPPQDLNHRRVRKRRAQMQIELIDPTPASAGRL
jgi:hypothetical protein